MVRIELDEQLINSFLRKIPDKDFQFHQGRIQGKIKLSIATVTVIVVPSFANSELIFTLPFQEIKSDIGGGFLLSKLLSTFWGTVSTQIEQFAYPKLRKHGLPAETLVLEKAKEGSHEVGRVKVSLQAVNEWLEKKPVRLTGRITEIVFTTKGVAVEGELIPQTA